jgi:hypothetical protein
VVRLTSQGQTARMKQGRWSLPWGCMPGFELDWLSWELSGEMT